MKRQHTAGNSFTKITICGQGKGCRLPRGGDVAAPGSHHGDVLPGQLNRGMLEHDDRRIERERAAEADAKTTAGVQLSDRPIVDRVWQPHIRGQSHGPFAHVRSSGSTSSVNGIARFCTTVNASSSTARELTMPNRSTTESQSALSAMADVERPNSRTSPRSGNDAPVAMLTNTSAVIWSSRGSRRVRRRQR